MHFFLFYIKLGLAHVLDFNAYDHILFLLTLALPFSFKNWKKVVVLATVFTVTHCLSLSLSVYDIMVVDISLIEFLIPITILLNALYTIKYTAKKNYKSISFHVVATAFFGLIHGVGFSNYFKILLSEEENIFSSLFAFAIGIEISQVLIVVFMLLITFIVTSLLKVKQTLFIVIVSLLIILITIPILTETFPY